MSIERVSAWEARLAAFLASARTRPHDYGAWDCLIFCAGDVEACTGKDFARGHRGKYRSAATASRYLRSLGFASPEALIDSLLPERPTTKARRGDIVLDSDGIPGVCVGSEALMVSETGLVRVPRAQWRRAWAVG